MGSQSKDAPTDYNTNTFLPPVEVQRELAERVPRVFDEWNYQRATSASN